VLKYELLLLIFNSNINKGPYYYIVYISNEQIDLQYPWKIHTQNYSANIIIKCCIWLYNTRVNTMIIIPGLLKLLNWNNINYTKSVHCTSLFVCSTLSRKPVSALPELMMRLKINFPHVSKWDGVLFSISSFLTARIRRSCIHNLYWIASLDLS